MTKQVNYGPNGTDVPAIGTIDLAVEPINFDADFLPLVDDPGVNIYVDATAPVDRPSTLRFATRDVANVYAGGSIDPTVYLSSRKGRDIVVQAQEIHAITDSVDTDYLRMYPIKATMTLSAPLDANVDAAVLVHMIHRLLAACAANGEDGIAIGLAALLRGVTAK